MAFSPTMPGMNSRIMRVVLLAFVATRCARAEEQQAPPAKNARILLVPRKMISGDRITLAVLDVNGRLTPGVTIAFSNGDHVTTDATGRGLFVAPLTSGVLYATIQGRPGRVQTVVLPAPVNNGAIPLMQAPHFASLSDRFELQGHGFCGDADKNIVQVNGRTALVLAASSESMIILPPEELEPGPADVTAACNTGPASLAHLTFLALSLAADNTPLQPGQKRTLSVRIAGTQEKVKVLAIQEIARNMKEVRARNGKILFVLGPAVIHTGAGRYIAELLRKGYIQVIFGGI